MKSKTSDIAARETKRTTIGGIQFLTRLILFGILTENGFVQAKHRKDTHKDEIRHDLK